MKHKTIKELQRNGNKPFKENYFRENINKISTQLNSYQLEKLYLKFQIGKC
jgi:hypothetical protein